MTPERGKMALRIALSEDIPYDLIVFRPFFRSFRNQEIFVNLNLTAFSVLVKHEKNHKIVLYLCFNLGCESFKSIKYYLCYEFFA